MVYSIKPQPKPLSAFIDRVRHNQRAICNTITEPIIHTLALLILSCPICAVTLDSHEAKVLDFFGAFWLFDPALGLTGYFGSEEEAVEYARSFFAETMNSTSAS